MPYFLATAAVESWLPPTSEVTSTPGIRFNASRCFWPKAPCPATQIFITRLRSLALADVRLGARGGALHLALARLGLGVAHRQDAVPGRVVRRRHGVEAIDLVGLLAERAAHDQPHDHLDAFGAGL